MHCKCTVGASTCILVASSLNWLYSIRHLKTLQHDIGDELGLCIIVTRPKPLIRIQLELQLEESRRRSAPREPNTAELIQEYTLKYAGIPNMMFGRSAIFLTSVISLGILFCF